MDDVAERTDVVIIGAGPAGLATAIELGDRSVAAIVAERRPDSSDHPRATALTEGTMETLRRWGVEGDVRRAGFPSEHAMSIRASLIGREIFRAPLDDHAWTCAQDRLEPILADRAQEAGARIRYGCELRSTKSSEGGVAVNVSGAGGRSRRTIRAQYAVGADGAHSAVREQSGMLMTRFKSSGTGSASCFTHRSESTQGARPLWCTASGTHRRVAS